MLKSSMHAEVTSVIGETYSDPLLDTEANKSLRILAVPPQVLNYY